MSRPVTLALGIVLALVVGAIGWWFIGRPAAEVEGPPAPVPAAPVIEAEPEPEDVALALPSLEDSDAFVRDLLVSMGVPAPLASALDGAELVRTFVVAVNRIAEGSSPRRQLGFLEPAGSFSVQDRDGKLYIDPAGYRRYDPVAAAAGSMDARAVARTLRQLQPLMEAAQAELGTAEPFESVLMRAIQVLLEVPILEGDIEVVDAIQRYRFADATLEALSPAQKHLVRMGPENTEAMQEQIRRVRDALATLPRGG
jgi:hypothetical protein